jgi:anti-anti-sigma regulatory factor
MRPVVARVFEITGAEAVFTVHATVEDALSVDGGGQAG